MAIVIQEILGTDPFSGSRLVINANFLSLKNEVELLESNLGISVASGNIDVSAASGGSIKGKTGAFNSIALPASGTPTITLTGSSGVITGTTLNLATGASIPTLATDNLTASALGNSVFNGGATFNNLVKIYDGLAYNKTDVGTIANPTPLTITNNDRVIVFDATGALLIVPDPQLVDGHVVTLISKGTAVISIDSVTTLATYFQGFSTGTIDFAGPNMAYKSSITIQWDVATTKWTIIGAYGMNIT